MSAGVKSAPFVSNGVAGTLEGNIRYTFSGRCSVASNR